MRFSDLKNTRRCRRKKITNSHHRSRICNFRKRSNAKGFSKYASRTFETVRLFIYKKTKPINRWNTSNVWLSDFPIIKPDTSDIIFSSASDYSSNKEIYN